ncbi:SCY1-like protein 2 [Anopheles ziemanni]|uniref:SCY1-like protein 2 n=1 Tax=Anopheles coustani TaxID=139045 RepID=UPI002659895D|nr:SCY1-like protein 2 [Anopheles coustani]XP_058178162.1 SCY1-like protein 2 [Anopheles ziemanni]
MPAATMFSKFKSSTTSAPPQNPYDNNPITQYFEIGKQIACAGPELIWKIHEGYRKTDGKECSIFVFEKRTAEKLHKPKRKETVTEILRASVKQLERFRHPKILQIMHTVEESSETLSFATEPVIASLANILAYQEAGGTIAGPPSTGASGQHCPTGVPRPAHAKEYSFLDIELKYGILQITEALSFLHYSGQVIHKNVCPSSILITKKGTWKLAGFEFTERTNETDATDPVPCQPWSTRASKLVQPNLDYMAPEIQINSSCSILSDMFSLGMVICAIFNHGRSLIQSGNSPSTYLKQMELLDEAVHNILPRIPIPLQEATTRLLKKSPGARPTAQLLTLIKYFSDPAVQALQFLDVINMKDPTQKTHYYRSTLREVLPFIPRKLWWQHIWPNLQQEMRADEVLAAVLQPALTLVQESSNTEYEAIILPTFKTVFVAPKSIQATVALLENLHIILEKTPRDDIRTEVLPLLFNALESTTIQVQSAALVAVTNVYDYLDDITIKKLVLPKLKSVFEKNQSDLKIMGNVLQCVERTLDKLDKSQIIDEVLPLLLEVRLTDPDIVVRVVNIYRIMLCDKKYGLTVNIMATKVMPTLLPQTVNPSLNLEQFMILLEVLQEMLDQIDRQQRNKLKLDNLSLPSPDRHRPLRHQFSSDNMNAQQFNIPNLRIDQRKTSSAEDMARKNSTGSGALGSWWFGGSPSSPDSNFLRVVNAFPNRRLSDNTLMTPKIRIAPSCASSPGGTPGGGLPIRRHSSIGPQERRGSNINLSPPTQAFSARGGSGSSLSVPSSSAYVGGSMPNTSSSVPFLLSSSMQSIRSRRTSTVLSSGPLGSGSGLLQQLGSGMRQLYALMTKDRFTPSGTSPSTQQQPAPRPHTPLSASATALNTSTGTQKLTSAGPGGTSAANLATANTPSAGPSGGPTSLTTARSTLASPSSLAIANQFAKCPSPSGSSSNIAVSPYGPGHRSSSIAGLGAVVGGPSQGTGAGSRVSPQPPPTSLSIGGSKTPTTFGGSSLR